MHRILSGCALVAGITGVTCAALVYSFAGDPVTFTSVLWLTVVGVAS